MIDIHSHSPSETSVYSLDIRNITIPNSKFSIGIHPWYIGEINLLSALVDIKRNAENPNCIFLGEMGLDRVSKIDFEKQREVLKAQLELAKNLNKPIILHCVKAYNDIIQIIKEVSFKGNFIFHDYNGDPETTKQLLNYPCSFSYGDKLFRETTKGYKSLNDIPLDRLFCETDECLHSITDAYNKLAEIKGIKVDELEKQIEENLNQLLNR